MGVCNRCYQITPDPCRNDTEREYCKNLTRPPKKETPATKDEGVEARHRQRRMLARSRLNRPWPV